MKSNYRGLIINKVLSELNALGTFSKQEMTTGKLTASNYNLLFDRINIALVKANYMHMSRSSRLVKNLICTRFKRFYIKKLKEEEEKINSANDSTSNMNDEKEKCLSPAKQILVENGTDFPVKRLPSVHKIECIDAVESEYSRNGVDCYSYSVNDSSADEPPDFEVICPDNEYPMDSECNMQWDEKEEEDNTFENNSDRIYISREFQEELKTLIKNTIYEAFERYFGPRRNNQKNT